MYLNSAVEICVGLAQLDSMGKTVVGTSELEVRDERRDNDNIKAESCPRTKVRVYMQLTLELFKHRLY